MSYVFKNKLEKVTITVLRRSLEFNKKRTCSHKLSHLPLHLRHWGCMDKILGLFNIFFFLFSKFLLDITRSKAGQKKPRGVVDLYAASQHREQKNLFWWFSRWGFPPLSVISKHTGGSIWTLLNSDKTKQCKHFRHNYVAFNMLPCRMCFVFPFVVVVHWWIRFLRSFPFFTNRQRDRLISISRLTFPNSISAREEESGHGSLDIQLHFHSFRVWYLSVRLSLSYRQHYAENLHFFFWCLVRIQNRSYF